MENNTVEIDDLQSEEVDPNIGFTTSFSSGTDRYKPETEDAARILTRLESATTLQERNEIIALAQTQDAVERRRQAIVASNKSVLGYQEAFKPPTSFTSTAAPAPVDPTTLEIGIAAEMEKMGEWSWADARRVQTSNMYAMMNFETAAMMGAFDLDGSFSNFTTNALISETLGTRLTAKTVEEVLNSTELTQMFLHDSRYKFDTGEKEMIAIVFSSLEPEERDNLAAFGIAWADNRPESLETAEGRQELIFALYKDAQFKQQRQEGGFFETFRAPFKVVSEAASSAWAFVSSPEDYAWRSQLSIGQSLAISLGQDPGTTGFSWASAGLDLAANVYLDPINWVTSGFAGYRQALQVPRLVSSRSSAMFRAAFGGRKAFKGGKDVTNMIAKLPFSSRSRIGRITYSYFSKQIDDLVKTPKMMKQFAEMAEITRATGGISRLTTRFPELKTLVGGGADMILDMDDPLRIAEFYADMMQATYASGATNAKAVKVLETMMINKKTDIDQATRGLLQADELGLDIVARMDGVNAQQGVYEVASDSALAQGGILNFVTDNIDEVQAGTRTVTREVEQFDDAGRAVAPVIETFTVEQPAQGKILLADDFVMGGYTETVDDVATTSIADVVMHLEQSQHPASNSARLKIMAEQWDQLTGAEHNALQRTMAYLGLDGLRTGPTMVKTGGKVALGGDQVILGKHAAKKVFVGNVSGKTGGLKELDPVIREYLERARDFTNATVGKDLDAWIVTDLPKVGITGVGRVWRASQATNLDAGWAKFKGNLRRHTFNVGAPDKVNLRDTAAGMDDLTRFFKVTGFNPTRARELVNEFAEAAFGDRMAIVGKAMREVAQELDEPLLQHGLYEVAGNSGVRMFALGKDGTEMVQVASRSKQGLVSARPIRPSQLSSHADLPNQDWYKGLRRLETARRLPASWGKGSLVSKAGNKNRKEMIDRMRGWMAGEGAVLTGLSDDDIYALAFSGLANAAMPGGQGVSAAYGAMSRVGNTVGNIYSSAHKFFVTNMLANRALPWMQKVVLIEEQIRAALFDMPSFFKSPHKHVMNIMKNVSAKAVDDLVAKQLDAATPLIANLNTGLSGVADVADALKVVDDLMPGWQDLARAKGYKLNDAVSVRMGAMAAVQETIMTGNATTLTTATGRGLRLVAKRDRQISRGVAAIRELGLDNTAEYNALMEGVANQSFVNHFISRAQAAVDSPKYMHGAMTAETIGTYATGWAHELVENGNDRLMRWAMKQMLDDGGGVAYGANHADVLAYNTTIMDQFGDIMREWARATEKGDAILLNDSLLAQAYLDEVVKPYLDNMYGFFWKTEGVTDAQRKTEALQSIISSKTVTHNGKRLDLSQANASNFRDDIENILVSGQHSPIAPDVPPAVAAAFDGNLMRNVAPGNSIPEWYTRYTNWVMEIAGEKATLNLTREPGVRQLMEEYRSGYLAMGFGEATATRLAANKAVEQVNKLMYKMDDVPDILKAMNRVSPFFSAAFEVTKTWTHTIPAFMGGGSALLGTPMLIRKVGRLLNGAQTMGLVQRTEDGRYTANLISPVWDNKAQEPQFKNDAGEWASKVGFIALNALPIMMNHLFNLKGYVTNEIEFEFLPEKFHDRTMEALVGHPLAMQNNIAAALTGGDRDELGGLFGFSSFGLPLSPPLSQGLHMIANIAPLIGDQVNEQATGAETLAEYADRTGVDRAFLLNDAVNRERLIDALGADGYFELVSNAGLDETFVLPSVALRIPNTGFVRQFIDETVWQYGEPESLTQTLLDYLPSWTSPMLNGLGLWTSNSTQDALNVIRTPMGAYQQGGALAQATAHLEATEGALSKLAGLKEELWELTLAQTNADEELQVGEDGLPFLIGPSGDQQEINALKNRILDLEATTVNRIIEMASSDLFFRGFTQLSAPIAPKLTDAGKLDMRTFYASDDLAQNAEMMGKTDYEIQRLPYIGNPGDFDLISNSMAAWAVDSRGSVSKAMLFESHPEVFPYLVGGSYWGAIGPPPEYGQIEDFFQQIADGTRVGITDPYILMTDLNLLQSRVAQEAELIHKFGTDPYEAAANMLNNPRDYEMIKERHETDRDAYMLWDIQHADGAYDEHKKEQRKRRDGAYADGNLTQRADEIRTLELQLEHWEEQQDLLPTMDMDPETRQTALDLAEQQIRAINDQLKTVEYNTYVESRPRQKAYGEYFSKVAVPYWTRYSDAWAGYFSSETPEEQAEALQLVNRIQNEAFTTEFTLGGHSVPNPIDWSWGKKTDAEKEAIVTNWVLQPQSWIDLPKATRIAELYPALGVYFPKNEEELAPYETRDALERELRKAQIPDEDGNVLLSPAEARKVQDGIDEKFQTDMIAAGLNHQLGWSKATDIQKLMRVGNVPPQIEQLGQYVEAAARTLAAQDPPKTLRSDVGRTFLLQLISPFVRNIEQDPGLKAWVQGIGNNYYDGDQIIESIVWRMVSGDRYGNMTI